MARKRRRSRSTRRRGGRRRRGFTSALSPAGLMNDLQAAMPRVGWGLVGYAGTSFVPTVAARFMPLPDKATNPAGYWLTKVLAASVTSYGVRTFAGRSAGRDAFVGALLTMGAEVVNQMIFPLLGLGAYLPDEMGAHLPGYEPAGYLNPGQTVDDYGWNSGQTVPRLSPDARL